MMLEDGGFRRVWPIQPHFRLKISASPTESVLGVGSRRALGPSCERVALLRRRQRTQPLLPFRERPPQPVGLVPTLCCYSLPTERQSSEQF